MSDTQVCVGTITSFFFLEIIFKILRLIKFAEDPEFTKVLYFTPSHLDHFFSNSITFGPCVNIVFSFALLKIF